MPVANKLYMAGGGFSGLTGFLMEIPPYHIQETVHAEKTTKILMKY
jgi:hypothetical protein